MRAIVRGICPPRPGLEPFQVGTRSAAVLARLCGVDVAELRRAFRLDNLVHEPVDLDDPRGLRALRRAAKVYPTRRGRRYILCGRAVTQALLGDRAPSRLLSWETVDGVHVAILPHPSPKNLWYNAPANRRAAAAFMRAARA